MKVVKALLALVGILAVVSAFHAQNPTSPVLLDGVHYYVSDQKAAEEFFTGFFAGRVLPHPGSRPLEFVTFLSLRAGEGTINISPRGPYPGVGSADPERWKAELIEPAEDLPPRYGVFWLGVRAPSMNQTLTRLEIEGIRVTNRLLSLPHDILARAVMIEGPDFSRIVLVERKQPQRTGGGNRAIWGDFGIDHLLLLVQSAKENENFFRDVFAGRVTGRRQNVTTMKIAGATIVLAEPEALGLKRYQVQPRDPKKFRYGIDQLTFLYADLAAAVGKAKAKGYRFLVDGVRVNYYDKPTPYLSALILSPDGLRCEMAQEDGRAGPRVKAATN
jgi:catechol 2,3-dioxygenase-like lactoylglutathione lyase family enzyme